MRLSRAHIRNAMKRLTVSVAPLIGLALVSLISTEMMTVQSAQAQVGLRVNPAPITAPLSRSLNTLNRQVSRSVTQFSNQATRSVGQINRSVNRSLNTMSRYTAGPRVRYPSGSPYQPSSLANRATAPRSSYYAPQSAQSALQSATPQMGSVDISEAQLDALRESQETTTHSQAAFGILPPSVLAQLNADQIGLQNAAQNVALEAEIGEIIEWTYEGVYGAVQVVSEHEFGTMLCREFKQTLTINDVTETATGNACARGNGQWARANY